MKTTRERAEEQFSAIQRQARRAQTDYEIEQQERAEHTAKLRALRLAKEADDRERARKARDENTAVEDKESTR